MTVLLIWSGEMISIVRAMGLRVGWSFKREGMLDARLGEVGSMKPLEVSYSRNWIGNKTERKIAVSRRSNLVVPSFSCEDGKCDAMFLLILA